MSCYILGATTQAVFDVIPELERLSTERQGETGDPGPAVDLLVERLREARLEGVRSLTKAWRASLQATGLLLGAFDVVAAARSGTRTES